MTSVVVGMIAWRTVEPMTVISLWDLARMNTDVQLDLHAGDALVTRARSQVATRFLRDSTADVLVTVDTDIAFNPESLLEIADQAHDLQSIVVAAYATRAWKEGQVTSYLGDQKIEFAADHTPVRIKWGASGFMAIPRSCLTKMRDELALPLLHKSQGVSHQYYPFYEAPRGYAENGDEIGMSEDFDFCQKAAGVGVATYVNPGIRLGHIGSQVYLLEHSVWKQPNSVPLVLTRQGIAEAAFPAADASYLRLKADEPNHIHLNRAERRRLERSRERVPA